LPDGIFSNHKSQFGQILEFLAMEDVGIFYGHLVYSTGIWYIFPVLVCCAKKNLATLISVTVNNSLHVLKTTRTAYPLG
jgi:hypothetical protein